MNNINGGGQILIQPTPNNRMANHAYASAFLDETTFLEVLRLYG